MCLAIPAQVCELPDDERQLAVVDILGVRRRVNLDLLHDDPPQLGDWVLVHVGFAMSKIGAREAAEQLQLLTILGEASTARDEIDGYELIADEAGRTGLRPVSDGSETHPTFGESP